MRALFVKLPPDKNIARIGYTIEKFINKNYQTEGFELLFEDNDGYCYMSPFSVDDVGNPESIIELKKLFKTDSYYLSNVLVVYFQETGRYSVIEGWYKHADVYLECQCNTVGGKYFNIKCKSTDAVYLPTINRVLKINNFDGFIVPNKEELSRASNFIDSFHGQKLNIVVDETLSKIILKGRKSLAQIISECENDLETASSIPKLNFQIIAKCEDALKKGLKSSKLYELLRKSYSNLKQYEKTLLYAKLAFKMNPNNTNLYIYAVSLGTSTEWEKAIPIFQKLLTTKALAYSKDWETSIPEYRGYADEDLNDDVRACLADLLMQKNHIKLAYNLYKDVTELRLSQYAKEMMTSIETKLPNLAQVKNYRISGQIISLEEQYAYLPIDQMSLPDIQMLHNKKYLLDPIRRKPVIMTPEEIVRQKTIRYLIDEIRVPESMILVEESLNHKDKSLKDRIDILVKYISNDDYRDLLIIECKEPNIYINGETIEQILRYNQYCDAKYLLLTNGLFSLIYRNAGDNRYLPCKELPDYKTMVGAKLTSKGVARNHEWHRPSRKKLELQEYRDNAEYWGVVGVDTPRDIAILALNLHYCLVDATEKLLYDKKGVYFNKIRDVGLTNRTIGDPSGSKFYLDSRWFEIQSINAQTINIYIAIGAFGKTDNDPVYGNRIGTSNIIVSVEHKGRAVPILELCLDRYAEKTKSSFVIEHDGRRSRKTNQSTLDYVSSYCPTLLRNGKVYLGTLDNSKSLSFSQMEVRDFFERLISYTLLRYELWSNDRN